MNLLTENLFEKILVEPAIVEKANQLKIVAGYATSNMANRHFDYLRREYRTEIEIDVVAGMYLNDGIQKFNHDGFVELQKGKGNVKFNCHYLINSPAVHSKVYLWLKDGNPIVAYSGSANYTQNGFSNNLIECLSEVNTLDALNFYQNTLSKAIVCTDQYVNEFFTVYEKKITTLQIKSNNSLQDDVEFDDSIKLTLLDSKTLETPTRSGLNWGQRQGREKNQAYINIPSEIGRSGFFPERGKVFTIITDDDKQLICVRAQDNGKGLHTTLNNSLLGEYFRYRLGVSNGEYITKSHLLRYGRTDVEIHKIDDETYFLDFSVSQ